MSSTWPPKSGLTSKVVPYKDSVFSISAHLRISAPASLVFEAIRNTDTYASWNPFVPNVKIPDPQPADATRAPDTPAAQLSVGTFMIFHVIMDAKKPDKVIESELLVTDLSTPDAPSAYLSADELADASFTADLGKVYRISWKQHSGFAQKGRVRGERMTEVIVLGENECELRTWEVEGGVMAHAIKWTYSKTLNSKLQDWAEGLKKYAEAKTKESS